MHDSSSQLIMFDIESEEQADLIVKSNSLMGRLIDIDYMALGPWMLHSEIDTHVMSLMHNEC